MSFDNMHFSFSDANPNKSVESELQKSHQRTPYEELQYELSCDVTSYMNCDVAYTIKRLLPGDLKVLYVGSDEVHPNIDPNPFEEGFECRVHEKKGGVYVTDNIVYNWYVFLYLFFYFQCFFVSEVYNASKSFQY